MSERTERNCNKCIHHTSGMCDSWNCKMQTVEDVKKEAVNEYVKVVVEELGMEMKASSGYSAERVSAFSRAIEIVKQGGVSDDVCEWKLEDDNLMTGCGDYFNLYDNCTGKFKYCPRCGKKIKVVE